MDFSLSDDHRMLQDSLRGILNRYAGDARWAALAEAGVIDALLTEAEGGIDGSGAAVALIFEELGRAGAALPLIGAMIGRAALAQAGRPEPEARAAFADAEPGTRADRGVAIRAEDGRLTGRKTMVAGADEATHLIVTTADALWLTAPGAEGLRVTPYPMLDGQRGADLDFTRTPAQCLGDLTEFGAILSRAVLAHAAQTLGAIGRAVDLTLDHLRNRQQFGRPLFEFQALAHRAADLAIEREQARSAVINLAAHLEGDATLRDRHVQACKVTVGRTARLVAEESIQLHGGIGMTEEYALAGIVRLLMAGDTAMGDADIHLERFARGEAAWL